MVDGIKCSRVIQEAMARRRLFKTFTEAVFVGGSGKQIDGQEAGQISQGGPSADQPQSFQRPYLGKVDL